MGLFDIFKKKPSNSAQIETPASEPEYNDLFLIETLCTRLLNLGYKVEKYPTYLALLVNEALNIQTAIINNPDNHPAILHLMTLTSHPTYFANGIEENIVGIGNNLHDKINSVLDNYINTTFLPIINSLSDHHNPLSDFTTFTENKHIRWHPNLGNLTLQGQWSDEPENEFVFELLKEKIREKITSNKFNWLKIYISKQADGTITGECLFNNEPWNEALTLISDYAYTWKMDGSFKGMKQFIMFRKCDAND